MEYQYGSQGPYCSTHKQFGFCRECSSINIQILLDKLNTYTLERRLNESKLPEDFIEI